MTIGIIGYLSERGLGNMTHDLRKQLGITKQLVIPDGDWPYRLDWCNQDELYLRQWEVEADDLLAWKQADGIDTVISIETFFGDNTCGWAKELGMKTILIPMWESFHPRSRAYQNVDLYLCPSFRCYQEVPWDNKIFLPYPIDIDEFQFKKRTGPATTFLHCAGSGGVGGRKGTWETIGGFLKAAETLPDIRLIVRSQRSLPEILPAESAILLESEIFQSRVTVAGPTVERGDQYAWGDVLIAPSHYEGHFLVGIEAMACGLPVITTDADPMSELFRSQELLVAVAEKQKAGTVNPHCVSSIVSIDDLAAKIRWCAENQMDEISATNRKAVEMEHSWNVLKPRWQKALELASR